MSFAVKNADITGYVEKVNNLEAPAAEPPWWTPGRVQRHLLEAFKTDDRMPRVESPKQPGSAHPTMEYTREEIDSWEPVPIDPRRFSVTRAQERKMNATMEWLAFVREADTQLYFCLRAWMLTERRGASHRAHCGRIGMVHTTLLRRKDRALSIVSSRLNADLVPVF